MLIYDEYSYRGLRSADIGQTWQAVDMPYQIVYFNGKYYGISKWGQNLVSSVDAGLTWQIEPGPNSALFGGLYSSGDRLFVMGADQLVTNTALYSSTDGVNWQYANDGLPAFFQYPSTSAYEIRTNHIWNYQGKYYLHDPTIGLFISIDTCKTWLPVRNDLYGSLELVDTTFFSGRSTFGGGVLKSALPQNYGSVSAGTVFKDDNENGVQEAGEITLVGVQVNITEPNAWFPFWFSTTGTTGHYAIRSLPHGGDTLRAQVLSNYVDKITPPLYIVNDSSNDRNFGVHFTADMTDLSASGTYAGRPRPGFELPTFLNYKNDGTLPANATISVKLDPNYQYISATPAPAAVFGDSLVWNVAQLPLFAHDRIHIRGTLNPDVPLGTLIKTSGYVMCDVADFVPANNQFLLSDIVVGAYDPNEKRVEPAAGLTAAEIAAGKELLYTIQFQNTGTYEAARVRITDRLDKALNFSTLRLVAASHDITRFQLLPGGLLEVVFDQIALPDSNANEAASHGFVTFAIQRNKAFAAYPYNIIRNKAAIYFDFNEPIITNTVTSTLLLTPVGTKEPIAKIAKSEDLLIVPNPNDGHFTVTTTTTLLGSGQLTLFNTTGQVYYQQSLQDLSQPIRVHAAMLASGIYFVQIRGKSGVLTGKVLVQE